MPHNDALANSLWRCNGHKAIGRLDVAILTLYGPQAAHSRLLQEFKLHAVDVSGDLIEV